MNFSPNILVLGETIIDKYNDSREIGGAPLNFASHLKLLGYNPTFVSSIGKDIDGGRITDFLKSIDINTENISINDHQTGACIITLKCGIPDYNIVSPAAYDYLDISKIPTKNYECIYFGTLIRKFLNLG